MYIGGVLMNSTDLFIDYDVFLKNYEIYKTMSDIPSFDFYNSLITLINPSYNKESIRRLGEYKEKVKNVDNALFTSDLQEKWAQNQLTVSLELIISILYADKIDIQSNNSLDGLKNGKGKILFYPHYGSYMSILPLLASQGIKFTVLMDEGMTHFWDEIIQKVSYGQNIKLHGIQNKKSMINVLHDIKHGYNLMMYPDFTAGETPEYSGDFLSKHAYIPLGPVKIAQKLRTDLLPVAMEYKNNQLLPDITIDKPIDCSNSKEVATKMMIYMEKIIKKDLSKWWCWEIYNDIILKK